MKLNTQDEDWVSVFVINVKFYLHICLYIMCSKNMSKIIGSIFSNANQTKGSMAVFLAHFYKMS
jgi:hypothetical protein